MPQQNVVLDAATIAQLLLIGSQLMSLIQQVRTQTPTTSPDVWQAVSSDFSDAVAAWDAITKNK